MLRRPVSEMNVRSLWDKDADVDPTESSSGECPDEILVGKKVGRHQPEAFFRTGENP